MEGETKSSIERRCFTCAFGAHDEDQEPCNACFDDKITLYSKWVLDPDYVMNLAIGTIPSDRLEYSIQILKNMYKFYKLGNPDKHDYDSYDLSEYLESISIKLPDMASNKFYECSSFQFDCRPLDQDVNDIKKQLNKFMKNVMKNIKAIRHNTFKSIPYAEIRSTAGRDITSIALNVMKNALLVVEAKENDIPNREIIEKIERRKPADTADKAKNAIDDIYRHQYNAKILIERVQNGTYPYDENGEWRLN